jgi:hypothetical protein
VLNVTRPDPNHPTKKTPEADTNPVPSLNKWSVVTIALTLLTLTAFSAYVVHHYHRNATNAATIIGIVAPAFATIGAAAFGVKVAYSTGKKQGTVTGKQTGAAEAARKLAPLVANARNHLDAHAAQINTQSASIPGSNELTFDPSILQGLKETDSFAAPSSPNLDPGALNEASISLAQLDAVIDSMTG